MLFSSRVLTRQYRLADRSQSRVDPSSVASSGSDWSLAESESNFSASKKRKGVSHVVRPKGGVCDIVKQWFHVVRGRNLYLDAIRNY